MKKLLFLAVSLFLLSPTFTLADDASQAAAPTAIQTAPLPAILSFGMNFGAAFPMPDYAIGFATNLSETLKADLSLPFLFPKADRFALTASAAWGIYPFVPNDSNTPTAAMGGVGATFYVLPWLSLSAEAQAGYYFSQLNIGGDKNSTYVSGFAWAVSAEADLDFSLGNQALYFGLRSTYLSLGAYYQGIDAYAVVGDRFAIGFGAPSASAAEKAASALPQALAKSAVAQASDDLQESFWSFQLVPAAAFTLYSLYDPAAVPSPSTSRANFAMSVAFTMPFWPYAFVRLDGGDRSLVNGDPNYYFGLEAGLVWQPLLNLELSLHAGPIYNLMLAQQHSIAYAPGANFGGIAGMGLAYYLAPSFSVGADVSFDVDSSRYGELVTGLSLTYHFLEKARSGGKKPPQTQPQQKPQPLVGTTAADSQPAAAAPQSGNALAIKDVSIAGIFPIFHTYYDDHPIGKLTIANTDSTSITDVTVSLIIRQYMDAAKECANLPELKAGEEKTVDIYALFKNTILDITQATKVAAEITVSGTLAGKPTYATKVETIRIYDRNAMTWDDNRKAAAFVTPKEPAVLVFSNNVNALLKGKMNRAIDKNLQTAIALHDALRLYGISYVSNPLTPYAVTSQDKSVVDTLKFPRQTFDYKSGDCSDLSILYSALMESVQIETAFITIPGHIFMAFALKTSPEEVRRTFSQTDQLIFQNDKVWVPVEVTERDKTFMDAWQEGATEWRDNLSKGLSAFYPIHDAWAVYEPVGLPGTGNPPSLPDANKLVSDFQGDVTTLVDREIYNKVAVLQAAITKSNESPQSVNALGVLYARYDLVDKAEREFKRAIAKTEYPLALVNLGNLAYLDGDMDTAIAYYSRANKKDPKNAGALLGIARANQAIENYATAKKAYNDLKAVDADLASRFAYLDLKGEESIRAAEISEVKDIVVWQE